VLGLNDLGPSGDGKYLFDLSGGFLALLQKAEPTKAEHTALSFEVPDARATIDDLTALGVIFEDYDFPGLKTVNKVCILGSEKAAGSKIPKATFFASMKSFRRRTAGLTDQSFTCTPASQTTERRGAAVAVPNNDLAEANCN
jgi:hypothetical protein